jgi:hypothetical protein
MTKKGSVLAKFLKSRGGPFLIIGIVSMVLALVALFLPWYTISASSEIGPLAQEDPVNLMTVDGVNGLSVNLFLGDGEATSGFRTVFSTQLPLAIIFAASLVLLALDIIATRNGKKLGKKFIIGAIVLLIPFILIGILISQLPNLLPWAATLLPGQEIPPQLETMVNSIAANPIAGATTQDFEVVGVTTVNWGFGVGAYLFLVTAILRIVSGALMLGTGEPKPELAT